MTLKCKVWVDLKEKWLEVVYAGLPEMLVAYEDDYEEAGRYIILYKDEVLLYVNE